MRTATALDETRSPSPPGADAGAPPHDADAAMERLAAEGETPYRIGVVESGETGTRFV